MFWFELAGFEFYDDVAIRRYVVEQQIDVEVVSIDIEVVLAANEREPRAKLGQCRGLGKNRPEIHAKESAAC